MVTLEAAMAGAEDRTGLLTPGCALGICRGLASRPSQAVALRHGQAVRSETSAGVPVGRRVRLYEPSGAFLGLAEVFPTAGCSRAA